MMTAHLLLRPMGWIEGSGYEEWLRTCAITTGDPNELVAQAHTRMPVILAEEYHANG
jgi:putative SOS response-associated peptidase YedK